jgi:signal transduction histidine kinase
MAGTAAGLDRSARQGSLWQVVRYVLIIAIGIALPYRRHYPRAVLAVIASGMVGLIVVGNRGPLLLALVLAIYSVTSVSPPKASLRAAVLVTVAVLLAGLSASGSPSLAAPPLVLVGWLAGENTRTRLAYIAGVREWAAERDRQREERSRRAVADERLRIARELHDVVAHTMSVVAVRSSVARVVMDSQPDEARQALAIIEVVSRRALHEMRLLVGVLRDGEATTDLTPAPGLADLPGLVAEIGAAGVPVTVRTEGELRPLPAGVDVSAFRIIQEALTNVVRHARPAEARLDLCYRPDEIEIQVTDDGGGRPRIVAYPHYPTTITTTTPSPAPSPAPALAVVSPLGRAHGATASSPGPARATPGSPVSAPSSGWQPSAPSSPSDPTASSGHGLVGMRERVALFGGTFVSGPEGTGYRVVAVLPTDERDPLRP